ncbi:MAG TPA: hypothetical protein VLI72_17290 [Methylibium sp.]|nr:hypothetical protein [Methylibium sp.]
MLMPRRTLLLTIAATAALAGCGAPPARAAAGRLVELQIVDRSRDDQLLPQHRHCGHAYVAGRPGDRYAVRLANRTGGRVLVVLSIDGINAVSGETAGTGQTGYVLAPWQSADIAGWRKSDAEAAAFYFTALPDSYAARTDRPRNVGVIGVAVFRERAPQPQRRAQADVGAAAKAAEGSAAAPAAAPAGERDASSSMARDDRLGTGHGEREYAPITRTSFERAGAQPAEVVQLRYDSYANLVASGVIVPRRAVPDPFPGYVPDPGS